MKKIVTVVALTLVLVPVVATFSKRMNVTPIAQCGGDSCSGDHGNDDREKRDQNS